MWRIAFGRETALRRVGHSEGAYALAVGESLVQLFKGDLLPQLGFAREVDYANERVGIPPRTMYEWVALARALKDRPLLRRAVGAGLVSPRKALTVASVAEGDDERLWTTAAMTMKLAELKTAVSAAGGEVPEEYVLESLRLRMTAEQQDRLDEALGLAREIEGYGAPEWRYLEAICEEWTSSFGDCCAEDEGHGDASGADADTSANRTWTKKEKRAWKKEMKKRQRVVLRQLEAVDEASRVIAGMDDRESAGANDALALDARILRLVQARRQRDLAFGFLAERFDRNDDWKRLGYYSFDDWCDDRMSKAPRTVREHIWLERRMRVLPGLREALKSGRISYSKALLIARQVHCGDVSEQIREAESTTWQQLRRKGDARESRRNRAAGTRRLWWPKEAERTIMETIEAAQAWLRSQGADTADAGEALAWIADHFVAVWRESVKAARPSLKRWKVLMRHGGCCGVPGCSRPAQHVHHIVFRSHCGADDCANLLGLCRVHHQRGIHRGYLTVRGRAGEWLIWRFGTREVWITEGDDDVSRANAEEVRDSAMHSA